MIHAIIIDDELHSRQSLERTLRDYCPEVQLVATCDSPEAGINAIREFKPDLVFLDVQMPNMSGFDMLKYLSPIDFEVIFVTSYDQYAIKAIKFSAIDYLLKPLDMDDLIQAVRRAKDRMHKGGNAHRYQSVLHNINHSGKIEKLAVPSLEGIDFFNTDDLIYCKADGCYTTLYLTDHQNQVISKNLKDFEDLLKDSGFCRVHNSFLINLKHIKKYIKGEGGYVIMSEGQQVNISRRRKDIFLNMLNRM